MKTLINGVVWLYLLSPCVLVLLGGLYLDRYVGWVSIPSALLLGYGYYRYLWIPVRRRYYVLDGEFIRRSNL